MKSQLAFCLNKEAEYERTLGEKESQIEYLQKQLIDLKAFDSNPKERSLRIENIFREKLNEAQGQIGFLKKEITCLNYVISQDETKMNDISEYV